MSGLIKPHLTGQTAFPLRKTTEPTFQGVQTKDVPIDLQMSNQLSKELKLLVFQWLNRFLT